MTAARLRMIVAGLNVTAAWLSMTEAGRRGDST